MDGTTSYPIHTTRQDILFIPYVIRLSPFHPLENTCWILLAKKTRPCESIVAREIVRWLIFSEFGGPPSVCMNFALPEHELYAVQYSPFIMQVPVSNPILNYSVVESMLPREMVCWPGSDVIHSTTFQISAPPLIYSQEHNP